MRGTGATGSGAPGAGATGVVAGPVVLAPAVAAALEAEGVAAVAAHHAAHPDAPGLPLADLRRTLARALRRRLTLRPAEADAAASAVVDALVSDGSLARDGDVVRDPARPAGPSPELAAAMDRLEAALAVPAPQPFADAVRSAGCPPEGVRALEQSGRIVRLDADLAFAATVHRDLSATALAMARRGPLTPAAFRDATGSSRKYALAILEDLDRRQVLRRGPDGHVPGPRAPRPGGPAR
jgi:selenocysteine-specific elongation factor